MTIIRKTNKMGSMTKKDFQEWNEQSKKNQSLYRTFIPDNYVKPIDPYRSELYEPQR